MVFRKPKKQPGFADLKGILAQYKEPDNALYQTVQAIIERLTQFQGASNEEIAKKIPEAEATKRFATQFATYLTEQSDVAVLPNSRQLKAGTNVTLDPTIPGELKINSAGGGGGTSYITETREIPVGIINGVNTTFTLANIPVGSSEQVFLNGLLQDTRSIDYSISGAVITFFIPPVSGDRILVTYQRI